MKDVEWSDIYGEGEILCQCDECEKTYRYEFSDGYPDFTSCQAEIKDEGWVSRKIDNDWFDFCSVDCYKNFLNTYNRKIRIESKPKVIETKNENDFFEDLVSTRTVSESEALKSLEWFVKFGQAYLKVRKEDGKKYSNDDLYDKISDNLEILFSYIKNKK